MSRQRVTEIVFLLCRIIICYGGMIVFLAAPPVITANQYLVRLVEPLAQSTGLGTGLVIPHTASLSAKQYATAQATELIWLGRSSKEAVTDQERLHLLDVHQVLVWASFVVACAVVLTILLEKEVIDSRIARDSRYVVVGLGALTMIVLVGFPIFFELFHQVFFPQGNYSFSVNSLIIQCFPPIFWVLNMLWLQAGVMILLWWQAHHADHLDI